MDVTHVKQALAAQAASVAEYLLPKGAREGREWRAGDVDGGVGRSLGVHLSGPKAGVWADFNTGECGDLLDLWMAVRRVGLSEAIREAKDWLGLSDPRPYREPSRGYMRPPKPACRAPEARVKDYLTEVRNIPEAILAKYRIGERGDEIIFPFLLPNGDLAMAKSRAAEDGGKTKPTAAKCEPVLFGWQAVDLNARSIVITEGEIDAMSWAAYGYPAMSVPFGGGKGAKQQWIENEFDRMAQFEKIYLATDMDQPGHDAAEEIANRLGRHRCYRVTMPHKDANECLVNGVPKAEMDRAIQEAANLDPDGLNQPSDYAEAIKQMFWPIDGASQGYQTPYAKLRDRLFFRPAEVTLWSGASGAGKSQVLSDCVIDWVRQGSRLCISSLEMKPASTLRRMVKQVCGVDRPTAKFVDATLTWLDQGLLVYDLVGKASVATLIQVFDYARGKYGCDQFVIDSLMRLGIAGDDYTGQEKAVYQLVEWAVAGSVHLHLVAHARKGGGGDGTPPEAEDIKGAMEIGANAFNILTVWRNRKLEADIQKVQLLEDGPAKSMALLELQQKPGVVLNVAKQRNGDFEGKVGLWFDQDSYRYYETGDNKQWSRTYLNLYTTGNSDDR